MVESLELGIDSKGASIDDYRHVDGARGSFQDRFLVYSRAGEPCVALRHADPEAARRRARDLRLPELPAPPARQAGRRAVMTTCAPAAGIIVTLR